MCGICGLWQPSYGRSNERPLDEPTLRAMSDRQAHRGPDDWGAYLNPARRLGFGFRRLAIIDLSPSGHQPMTNEDESLWIVYNGEIYNYPALRQELLRAGHQFRSTSDTEVILHGYEQWGEGVLRRLRGMFAFALWNERAQSLLLARDRLGIKPLHYYWDGKRFAFASEIKSLLALPGLDTSLDSSAVWDYFTYLYIPTPKTAYRRIRTLPPAHWLKLTALPAAALPDPQPYWDVTRWGTAKLTQPQAVEAVREKLRETVQAHLIADVPVGLLLSGGLDSSAVAAFAGPTQNSTLKTQHSELQTFSIGFDVAEHSELPYAQIVAEAFGTLHRTHIVSHSDYADAPAKMLALYDQPFADASGLPTLAVSQLAAWHVKVALAGDGGDETLAGYVRYRKWQELAQGDWLPAAARHLLFEKLALGVLAPVEHWPKAFGLISAGYLDLRGKDGPDRYGALISPVKSFQKPKLLPGLAREFRGYDDYWHLRRYWRADLDDISCMQYVDLKTYLPDDILTKVDRASMAASLEVRVPLLDHEWVELAASLPTELRFNKAILREAMTGILPESILHRKKKGFSVPLLDWQAPATRNGARLGGLALWAAQLYDAWRGAVGVS